MLMVKKYSKWINDTFEAVSILARDRLAAQSCKNAAHLRWRKLVVNAEYEAYFHIYYPIYL